MRVFSTRASPKDLYVCRCCVCVCVLLRITRITAGTFHWGFPRQIIRAEAAAPRVRLQANYTQEVYYAACARSAFCARAGRKDMRFYVRSSRSS